ncbi:hypothetical protein Patl1_11089 [Pistacia atlantica]|uniref:Uncharacterized protein n=1 Tax=Pistacia atlantica TaxID=434234 RepID=A0ACC1A7W7_9ROSI|nr:hypothetical protein Patl1_11089 [Pistacia atlantica]
MNFFQCCRGDQSPCSNDKDTSTFASFVNALSLKTDSGKQRNINAAIRKFGKSKKTPHVFRYHELAAATDDFHPDYLVGEGGFGSVYKGYIESLDQVVAVKQLDRNGTQGSREFFAEVVMLSLVHHPNLVNLIGYCVDDDQRILVYEFMSNGSLENHFLEKHAKPLLRDKQRFTSLADPLLEGNCPPKGLYQALAIAGMCLQEDDHTRPSMSDVVTALEYLANPMMDEKSAEDDQITDNGNENL